MVVFLFWGCLAVALVVCLDCFWIVYNRIAGDYLVGVIGLVSGEWCCFGITFGCFSELAMLGL